MQKLISEMFGLQGWIIYRCETQKDRVDIYVGRPRKEARCVDCGHLTRKVHARSVQWREILHSEANDLPVYLRVKPRRFRCGYCGRVFTEVLPGVEKWGRQTEQAQKRLLKGMAGRSIRSAATEAGTTPGVLRRVLVRRVTSYLDIREVVADLPAIVLSFDEHSFRGQDMMITVTCVWPERRLLAILPNDRLSTLKSFLKLLPAEVREKTIGVCTDMKQAWQKPLETYLPKATRVVDHFHLIQDANKRVDEARRVEQQVTRQKIARWPLLKNEEDLTDRQAYQLAEIRKKHKNVAHFHWVKEQLRDVYDAGSREEAEQILGRIILNTEQASDAALIQWGRTLKQWRSQILAYHGLRVSNGYTEGVHTKIKLLKRLSYGFRNREIYVRKMLLAFVPLALLVSPPHFLT